MSQEHIDDLVVYAFIFGPMLLMALVGLRPKRHRRNKRTGLPAPSEACKRRGTEAVP